MNRLLEITARALEPGEREVILGDLAERGLPAARGLLDIFGLVVRRQLLIWTNWRPWFALIGIVGVSGFYLGRMQAALSMALFEQITAWRRYGVHYNTGVTSFRDDVIHMTCLAAAIFCWTAVNASLLRRLSGRAGWLTGLLFYVVVFDSPAVWMLLSGGINHGNQPWWSAVRWLLPHSAEAAAIVICLFVIPVICGALGKMPAMTPITILCTITAVTLGGSHAHDLEAFSGGTFPAASWSIILAPYALVSWPVLIVRRMFRSADESRASHEIQVRK